MADGKDWSQQLLIMLITDQFGLANADVFGQGISESGQPADMLSFWKKMRDNARKISDFFKKNPFTMLFAFPMSTEVVNPAVRDAEMLTANLAVRLMLAPVAGHNPVKRSCIFCIKI